LDYDLKSSQLITERAAARSPALPLAQKRFAVPANGGTTQGEIRGTWGSLLRSAWGTWQTHALALADQAVVSGASFLTTVVIARWTPPSELGVYSLGISLVVSWLGIQESLIALPYTVYRHRPLFGPAEHAGSSLIHSWLLSALAIVVMAVIALGLSAGSAGRELVAPIWALVGLVPFALLREFCRRFAFAHLHMAESLMLDTAVGAMQLAGVGVLAWTGRLSATTAFAAIGVACGLASVMWLYLAREHFVMRGDQLRETMLQSWSLGKWLFANELTLLLQGNVTYWLLAWVAGTAATGVYAACMSVALFANPLLMGLGNILAPSAASALTEGGGAQLRRQAIRDSLLLGAAMTLFCLVVLFARDDVMRLLYHDQEYEGHGHTVLVLALAMLSTALGMPASGALTSIERPREVFWIGSFGAALTVVLVWCLVAEWGVLGAAYGFLAGNTARSAARWVVFLALVGRSGRESDPVRMDSDSRSAPVTRVLKQFTQSPEDRSWLIEQIDEGVQAKVYTVQSQNRQPIWQTYRNLVIKVYKPDAAPNVELVRAQFDSLSRLHAMLNGRTISGWKTFIPAALYVCESPLALVMTEIPGTMLSLCLETGDNVTPEVLESVPRAVVTAMDTCWSTGQLHGDLHLDNILCDIVNRDLSFIDLGVPANSYSLRDDVTKRWYPASHDLAFLLFNTGVRVRSTIGKPGARLRQQMFAESVLRVFIETIGPFEDKQALLDEIHGCARAHLRSLDLSLSPRGLWHLLLRLVASRRIDRLLARLRTHVGGPVF
jgi:O-antigen/teichoic acid export membrane protein